MRMRFAKPVYYRNLMLSIFQNLNFKSDFLEYLEKRISYSSGRDSYIRIRVLRRLKPRMNFEHVEYREH